MTIGEKIRDLRTQRGLTLKELAKAAHTSFQNIYKYENGIITNIPLDKIEMIANALEVKPADLLGWADKSSSPNDTNGTAEYREKLRRQPGMRMMLDAADGATEEEIKQYVNVIKAMRKKLTDDD